MAGAAEKTKPEPDFDVSDLPIGGATFDEVQQGFVDALQGGAIEFDDNVDPDVLADAVDAQLAEKEQPVETEDEPVEAEAAAEDETEDEIQPEKSDETSYPMPDILTWNDERETLGIEIDGDFHSVEDLAKSPYFQADYTRDKQATRAERERYVTEAQDLAKTQQEYLAALDSAQEFLTSSMPIQHSPDELARLRVQDKEAYLTALETQQRFDAQLAKIEADRTRAQQELSANQARQRELALRRLDEELPLRISGWSDRAAMESEAEEVIGWLSDEFDLSAQERQNMLDPRFWQIAVMAYRGQKTERGAKDVLAGKKKRAKIKGKTLRPQRAKSEGEKVAAKERPLKRAEDRAYRTQDMNDWGNFFTKAVEEGRFD